MRNLILIVVFILGLALYAGAETYRVDEMTLSAFHRIYKNYHEELTVKMGERFYLSDGEYSGEAIEFYPDFEINANTKEVISRSSEPNNPAVRIVVFKNNEPVDTVWAFPGEGPPHYYRDSLLAFKLEEFSGLTAETPGEKDAASKMESEGEEPNPEKLSVEENEPDAGVDSTSAPAPGE